MYRSLVILFTVLIFGVLPACGQCLENAGFEDGTFYKWECRAGLINLATKQANLITTNPIPGRHDVLTNSSPQQRDIYGDFPVNCPNGSGHSVKLGNAIGGSEAESISYTYTIPNNQPDFTITYYYAIVLQNNSSHSPSQQAKFTARIYNVTDDRYEACGSFEFAALSGNSGFLQQPAQSNGGNDNSTNTVFYKPWTPITVNLKAYQGKTIRLEFTTYDCAPTVVGQHFAYAYIDVAENCLPYQQSPVTGNTYCPGENIVTLKAPPGFQEYTWYKSSDLTTEIGTGSNLQISPAPAEGETYTVKLTPFPGYGCESILSTTIHASTETYRFNVPTVPLRACASTGYNLKQPDVTAGSVPNLTFEYFTDANGDNYVSDPERIMQSGTYYIRGTNNSGCSDMKSVQVIIEPEPTVVINAPPPTCATPVNITNTQLIRNYSTNLNYSYWMDINATIPVSNPSAVTQSGTYYVKAVNKITPDNQLSCYGIAAMPVVIEDIPTVITNAASACTAVNLRAASVTQGSTAGLEYTYWLDAATTQPLANVDAITVSGTYYIRGHTALGCESPSVAVKVTVYPEPQLAVTDPEPVIYPAVVQLNYTFKHTTGNTYTYWRDAAASVPLDNYDAVTQSGRYFIKAENRTGCILIQPVNAIVYPPAIPEVSGPNTFTPNGDGVNDLFKLAIVGVTTVNRFTIFNRWGQTIYELTNGSPQWDGTYKGQVQPFGTYYWVLTYRDTYRNTEITKSGSITIVR